MIYNTHRDLSSSRALFQLKEKYICFFDSFIERKVYNYSPIRSCSMFYFVPIRRVFNFLFSECDVFTSDFFSAHICKRFLVFCATFVTCFRIHMYIYFPDAILFWLFFESCILFLKLTRHCEFLRKAFGFWKWCMFYFPTVFVDF